MASLSYYRAWHSLSLTCRNLNIYCWMSHNHQTHYGNLYLVVFIWIFYFLLVQNGPHIYWFYLFLPNYKKPVFLSNPNPNSTQLKATLRLRLDIVATWPTTITTQWTSLRAEIWHRHSLDQPDEDNLSYVNFSFVKMMPNVNSETFWNPEILPKLWDF